MSDFVPHEKLDKVATPSWVRANVADREVCDFFVRTLQAKVVK